MTTFKVASHSNPNSLAGAIAGDIRSVGRIEVQAIIARGFVAPQGLDLICIPAFTDIDVDGEERTAIRFIVEPR